MLGIGAADLLVGGHIAVDVPLLLQVVGVAVAQLQRPVVQRLQALAAGLVAQQVRLWWVTVGYRLRQRGRADSC